MKLILGSRELKIELRLWKRRSNVPAVASGITQQWTNPQAAGKPTWKTAKFVANPMFFTFATIRKSKNLLLRRSWNKVPMQLSARRRG